MCLKLCLAMPQAVLQQNKRADTSLCPGSLPGHHCGYRCGYVICNRDHNEHRAPVESGVRISHNVGFWLALLRLLSVCLSSVFAA